MAKESKIEIKQSSLPIKMIKSVTNESLQYYRKLEISKTLEDLKDRAIAVLFHSSNKK
jgi:hypothetical protein